MHIYLFSDIMEKYVYMCINCNCWNEQEHRYFFKALILTTKRFRVEEKLSRVIENAYTRILRTNVRAG